MSFVLKSVELKNIRAHEYFLFEPALEGITAISGENGAGKSTIVDAFAWCLYGTRPSGVKNKDLIKDGVDPKEKPVSIKSTIIVGGIEYIVERKILNAQGTAECNVWGKLDGKQEFSMVAGPAVSHVETFIKNELGMNEKGFLTSVLIQQKQVDQIVSASPKERGAVIEELTGIASITQAIAKVNENTRSLQKAASIFHRGDVGEAEAKVKKQEEVYKEICEKGKQAVKIFAKTKEESTALMSEFESEQIKVNKRIKLTHQLENTQKQIDFLKKQSEDDLKYIMDYKEKYGTTIMVDVQKSKKELDAKRAESFEIKSESNGYAKDLERVKDTVKKCEILQRGFSSEKDALESLASFETQLANDKKALEEMKSKKSMISSEIKHAEASHTHLNGEDTKCPVCRSNIEDPKNLLQQIETEIQDHKKELKKTNDSIKKLSEEIEVLEEKIKETLVSVEAIKERERMVEEEATISKKMEKLSEKNSVLLVDLKVLEQAYDNALRIEADKNALEAAKARSLTVHSNIEENKKFAEEISKEIAELNALSDRSLAALDKRNKDAQAKLSKMSVAGKELVGRKKLELERLEDYKKQLQEVEDAMKKYNEIAEQINVSTGAAAMLAAFKADRIEHAIPTLEFFASDFLSKFTGGAFTNLKVDEKFNTFVTTAEGILRPVAQLSGGELSSAAIALRLGIAMLLNSSEKNVLILDEVLVSMDEDRSRQIMETIGSMTNSQVIFIAHNTDINSVADKTVLVAKQGEEEV